jgi:hypothetical protein
VLSPSDVDRILFTIQQPRLLSAHTAAMLSSPSKAELAANVANVAAVDADAHLLDELIEMEQAGVRVGGVDALIQQST